MIECEGMIANQLFTILVDLGASLSYVSPKAVEGFQLQSNEFQKLLLVKLATGAKWRVAAKTKHCRVDILGQQLYVNLNILLFGSYG